MCRRGEGEAVLFGFAPAEGGDVLIVLTCRGLPPPLTRPVPPLEGGCKSRTFVFIEAIFERGKDFG